ncbi:hypothetical protein EYF80_010521 [Liparis tanakae]|uniref:Uncharacterized protein n=1 Tax=Liparis tanakae TaxID=230148 RepID=A0A4Z2IN19_9TELE|nr:hypothetical protein EYF80_010521 [Liparis tanakae]
MHSTTLQSSSDLIPERGFCSRQPLGFGSLSRLSSWSAVSSATLALINPPDTLSSTKGQTERISDKLVITVEWPRSPIFPWGVGVNIVARNTTPSPSGPSIMTSSSSVLVSEFLVNLQDFV